MVNSSSTEDELAVWARVEASGNLSNGATFAEKSA